MRKNCKPREFNHIYPRQENKFFVGNNLNGPMFLVHYFTIGFKMFMAFASFC